MGGPKIKGFTAKQRRFVDEYCVDCNATQAAIRAGFSARTAGPIGSEYLKKPHIKEEIDRKLASISSRLEATADNVRRELARIALFDPRKLYDTSGNLIPIKDLGPDEAACVASLDIEEIYSGRGEEREISGNVKKIRLWNKNQALKDLALIVGLLKEADGKEYAAQKKKVYILPSEKIPDFEPPSDTQQ